MTNRAIDAANAFAPARKPNTGRAADALRALADQFEMAADGRNPQAR